MPEYGGIAGAIGFVVVVGLIVLLGNLSGGKGNRPFDWSIDCPRDMVDEDDRSEQDNIERALERFQAALAAKRFRATD
jgi:hypothetical protein